MSLNIKNERTHDLVKRLARLTAKSQTHAVEDAVERRLEELERGQGMPDFQWHRVEAVIEQAHHHLTPQQQENLGRADDELYDQHGLPR